MLSKIKIADFIKGSAIIGLEAIILPDGKVAYNAASLLKSKAAVEITATLERETSEEILTRFLSIKQPVLLVINGKGLLHKKVQFSAQDTTKTLLQKVLPNANEEDFYVQKTHGVLPFVFVSVIRKSVVDGILEDLKTLGASVIGCSLGPFPVQILIPLLDNQNRSDFDLHFSCHHLTFAGNEIHEYSLLPEPGDVSVLHTSAVDLKKDLLLAFATGFHYFIDGSGADLAIPALSKAKEEFRQKQIFNLGGWLLLIAFLSILMLNYFVFNYYWTKKNEISQVVAMNQAEMTKFELLEKEYNEKQQFFEKTGMLEASRTSYYADQLAQNLPPTIQLTLLHVFPLVKKLTLEENTMSFVGKTIDVSGLCKKSTELNQWIKIIKAKKWVNEVTLLNFSHDKSKETGEFSIELKIK